MALPHDRIGRESLHLHRRQPPFLDQPMTGRAEQRHPMTLRQPQITVDGHATSDAGETASLADIVLLLRGQFRQRRHHTQAHARRPLAITRPRHCGPAFLRRPSCWPWALQRAPSRYCTIVEINAVKSRGCWLFLPLGQQVEIAGSRSEEHTSELQSLMRISYAVFCLKKKKNNKKQETEYPELHVIDHSNRNDLSECRDVYLLTHLDIFVVSLCISLFVIFFY